MRNFVRDTVIYGAAAVLSRGLALIALPIYTRILSPADYGALDMITVAGTLAALIVSLEVAQAVARFHGEAESDDARRALASTALWFTVGTYGIALAIALIGTAPLSAMLLGPGHEPAFRVGVTFIAVTGVFFLLQSQLRIELRAKAYAMLSIAYAAATVSLGIVLGNVLDLGLMGVLFAQLSAAAIAVGLGFALLRGSFGLRVDGQSLRKMLHFSAPLVPSGLATFLTLYANRLLLNAMISLEAVGLFGVAARIAGIIALLTVGLQSSLTPLIYAHYKEAGTPARIAQLFEIFLAISLFASLTLGLFAPELIALLAEERYAHAGYLVMSLAPATLLSQIYIFFPGIAISRKTHLQLIVFAITGAVSLGANWLLIGAFGLSGAAGATLLASLLFLVIWIAVSQRLYPIPVRWPRIALFMLIFTLLAAAGLALILADISALLSAALRLGLLGLLVVASVGMGIIRSADLRWIGHRIRARLP